MAEYIEREHLKDKFNRYLNAPHVRGGYSIGQGMRVAIKSCIAMLDEEPPAEVEPVRHGRWIISQEYNDIIGMDVTKCTCSVCGQYRLSATMLSQATDYCPNCGARMDGGADNG